MPRIESEPTHSIIFRNGNNGVLRPKFAGVTEENYFDFEKQIYKPIEEMGIEQPIEEMPTGGQTQ